MSGPAPALPPSVRRNAAAAVAQVVLSGLLLFVLYRYLLDRLGASSLGVWSLVLASTNVARLGALGLQGTAVRFVARDLARGSPASAARYAETAVVATAFAIGLMLALAYPLIGVVLERLVDPSLRAATRELLPYALGSLWVGSLGGVAQSALDGCQRIAARSAITVGASVVLVAGSVALVPSLGLRGVALAQLAQGAWLFGLGWRRLRRSLPDLPVVPRRIDRPRLREMLRFGANVQAESLLAMLHDPIAKGLLAHFSGLPSVAYFEMATRLTQQLRALVTAALQVLVPVIAGAQEHEREHVRALYRSSGEFLVLVSVPAFGLLVVAAPLIGHVWLGRDEPTFVLSLAWLAIAWWVNTISAPAISANFGTGFIASHTVAALLIAVVNLALGLAAGQLWPRDGVLLSWVTALVVGSLWVIVAYHRRTGTPAGDLLTPASRGFVLVGVVAAVVVILAMRAATPGALANLGRGVGPLAYLGLMAVAAWWHPAARGWLLRRRHGRAAGGVAA
ncbi:MAG: oligosaccharide flippase family protein [Proteobacteria bacterium]|nr:oligosaccharide flippase family protein [Pseudomonadota bacterium]